MTIFTQFTMTKKEGHVTPVAMAAVYLGYVDQYVKCLLLHCTLKVYFLHLFGCNNEAQNNILMRIHLICVVDGSNDG